MRSDIDPVLRLEHDHEHLNRIVGAVRDALQARLRGEGSGSDLSVELEAFFAVLQEDVYGHFAREEEGLFPYLAEQFPDTRPIVESLEVAHDRMCGIASRLEHLVRQSDAAAVEHLDAIVTLFARFDANHARHAKEERELLRSLADRLNPSQRREMARILAQL